MRLAKFILNLIQLVFVYLIISVVTFGTYTLVAYQSDDDTARFTFTNKPDRVWMLDNFSYWGSDIASSFSNTQLPQPKLRVALWFDWNWWQNSMSNVDKYFVNPVVSFTKPVITPITCANEISKYYKRDLTYFSDYINANVDRAIEFRNMVFDCYGVDIITFVNTNPKDGKFISDTALHTILYDEVYLEYQIGNLNILVDRDINNDGKKDIFNLADEYNYFYQLLYKLNRYNRTNEKYISEENPEGYVYYKWHKKFVIDHADGKRSLTTAVYALYTLNYVNIILAFIYAWANPIRINTDETGALVPGRSIFTRFKRVKRKEEKKRRKHKHKHDEDSE